MTVEVNPGPQQRGRMTIKITGAASAAAGGLGSVANLEGVPVLITRSQLYVETPSTGAANLGIGVVAAATTAGTDVLNDLAVNGSITGKVYNGNTIQVTAKTEITAPAVWTAAKFLTFTGSATTAGFVGWLFIEYVRLT
jgi:hypothetical protein